MASAAMPDSAEADEVEAGDAVVPLLDHEGRDVLRDRPEPAEHRQAADPDPLLDRAVAGEDAAVVQLDVAGDEGPVDERAVVADRGVVPQVAADHEHVPVADPGLAAAGDGPPVDGDVLAEDVAVADPERGRLAPIPLVLGALAEHGAVADEVVPAHLHRPAEAGVRLDDRPLADPDRPLDDRVRPDLDVEGQFRLGGDHGGRVDQLRSERRHHPVPP